MRGHITKRGKDSYTVVINLGSDPATGKRKQQWVSVKGTKKDAEKKLGEILHQIDTGVFTKPGKTRVGDYLEQWLKDYCWANLTPGTAESYQWIVRVHLIPAIGQLLLTDLKPQHLQHLYSEKLSSTRKDGNGLLSTRTVQYMHVTLHKALSDALKLGMISRNPAEAVERPRTRRRGFQIMNEKEIMLFLELAKSTPYYSLFYLVIFTGLRRSELLALNWSDVDLILCQLSISKTIHHLHDGQTIFAQPKTAKGRRLIALSPSTVAVLREEYNAQAELKKALGMEISDDDLIFCHIDGSPLLPDTISHVWIRLAKRCGLDGVRLHDCRHTHASLLLKQNIHPKVVSERLGHASVQITLDTYSHVTPGLQQAAANRFDDIVLPDKKLLPETVG